MLLHLILTHGKKTNEVTWKAFESQEMSRTQVFVTHELIKMLCEFIEYTLADLITYVLLHLHCLLLRLNFDIIDLLANFKWFFFFPFEKKRKTINVFVIKIWHVWIYRLCKYWSIEAWNFCGKTQQISISRKNHSPIDYFSLHIHSQIRSPFKSLCAFKVNTF